MTENNSNRTDGTDERTIPTRRRGVLAGLGGALALGLAGCSGSTSEQRTYEAPWVSLEDGGAPAGLSFETDEEITRTRTEELASLSVEATIVSHAATYEGEGSSFLENSGAGVLASPVAEAAGQRLNPLATRPIEDLVDSDLGREFLGRLGVDRNWQGSPERLRETAGEMLGAATPVETYRGTTTGGEVVLFNVARVTVEGNVVFAGDARKRPVGSEPEIGPEIVDEAAGRFLDVLPLVVLERARGTDGATDGEGPPARIPMSEVPREFRRRGARFIERGLAGGADWDEGAQLGSYAYPVGRPDVEGVAYYELEVDPGGFVLCATGEHDGPVPHFNTGGVSIGRTLEQRADGGRLARVVWIDRQRFVGEDPDGNRIATRGNAVPRIRNPEALAEAPDVVTHVEHGPREDRASDDAVAEDDGGTLLASENRVEPPEASFDRWESYDQLKENYEESYGPLIEDLRERAAGAWETYRKREQGSRKVGTHRSEHEPLVGDQSVADVSASAGGAFEVQRIGREVGQDVLSISPTGSAAVGETLTVTLEDDDGGTETFEYRAVEPDEDPGPGGQLDAAEGGPTARTWWAGGARLQPWFYQYRHGGCFVGCGPVAWAILFAWGDRQADGGQFNASWNPRWGLFRQNGGYGRDAVAPKNHDSNPRVTNQGVRNVIEELNRRVDVFCINNSGATWPWKMDQASGYLWGRTGTKLECYYNLNDQSVHPMANCGDGPERSWSVTTTRPACPSPGASAKPCGRSGAPPAARGRRRSSSARGG